MIRTLSWMMCAGAIAMGCGGLERAALRREAGRAAASRASVIDSSARHPAVGFYDLTCTADRCEAQLTSPVGTPTVKSVHTAPLPSALLADSLELRLNDATSVTLNDAGDIVSQRPSAKPVLTAKLSVGRASQNTVR